MPSVSRRRPPILASNQASTRWSFGAAMPSATLCCSSAGRTTLADADATVGREWDDPFAALAWMADQPLAADERWVGFIGYGLARFVERLPTPRDADAAFSLFAFARCRGGETPAEPRASIGDEDRRAPQQLARIVGRSMARDAYLVAAQRALDYIAAGDVFQLNLAQRFSVATTRSPAEVFHALPPAAFGALIDLGDAAIVSNSPELFFRIGPGPAGTRRIVNRPIKGTRPIAPGAWDDLNDSAKDRAELAMIVDLQRNDLGRVCEIGSVRVVEPRVIEATPSVYHGVATIAGTLRDDAGFADVVRAIFPCGSITGVPKVRAMQIIDGLEPVDRGPYCGAIGYLDAAGRAEFSVAIRTMTMRHGIAHVSVGGGIVADSMPEAEYEETLVKATAMFTALGVDEETICSLRAR